MNKTTSAIRINGSEREMAELISCQSLSITPTKEEIDFYAGDMNLSTNLLTDVMYYNEKDKQLCRFSLYGEIPGSKNDIRIDDIPGAKVVFINNESTRSIAEITVLCGDKDAKKKLKGMNKEEAAELKKKIKEDEALRSTIESVLAKNGIDTVGYITYDNYIRLMADIRMVALAYGKIIEISITKNKKNPSLIDVTAAVRELPQSIKVESAYGAPLTKEEATALAEKMSVPFIARPDIMIRAYYQMIEASDLIAFDAEARNDFGFTPEIKSAEMRGNEMVFIVAARRNMPGLAIDWSPRYRNYLDTLSDEDRARAEGDLFRMRERMQNSNNMQDLSYRIFEMVNIAKNGHALGQRSYLLSIDKDPSTGVYTIERAPLPTKIEFEHDIPEEDVKAVEKLLKDARVAGLVDMDAVAEAEEKIRMYFETKGYKIKEIMHFADQNGTLTVSVKLRRWDLVVKADIIDKEETDDVREKNSRVLAQVMAPYEGKFITERDLLAIEKQLARGMERSLVKPLICTDTKTGKDKVVFLVAEEQILQDFSFGLGGGSQGLMLQLYYGIIDDGKGKSFSIDAGINTQWKFFKSWNVKDITAQNINLKFAMPVGPNEKISVGVYEWSRSYNDESMLAAGANTSYKRYFLNDDLEISIGGGLEYIDPDIEGDPYGDVPVRGKVNAGVCYKNKGFQACINNDLTIGSSTYNSSRINMKYVVPLSKTRTDIPAIVLTASGGIQAGDVPAIEQYNQMDTGAPFAFSLMDGSIHSGKYYASASVQLVQMINDWFTIKPLVISANLVGNRAAITFGSCFGLGPVELCVGYGQGLWNADSGVAASIGTSDSVKLPAIIERAAKTFFFGE